MVFEVRDYYDFVRLLYQHPEWREELGNLLIAQEIRELPQIVRELAEAQKRTEQRVEELAEAQQRSEERLTRLEQVVAELAEAQKRTEQRVEELAKAQEKTEQQVQRLITQVNALTGEMGNVRGELLEIRYRQYPFSFFGRLVSRVRVVDLQDIWPEVEERLSEEELNDLLELDLLLQGRVKRSLEAQLGRSDLWLAVEISAVVDGKDVERARRRADLLQKAGIPTLAIAAGRGRTEEAEEKAKKLGVLVQTDGRTDYLAESLAYWKNATSA